MAMGVAKARCQSPDTILAFVQGRSSPEEQRAIDEHIDGCDDCRRLVAAVAASPHVTTGASAVVRAKEGPLERFRELASFALRTEPAWEVATEEERAVLQRRLCIFYGVAAGLVAAMLPLAFVAVLIAAPSQLWPYVLHPHQGVAFLTAVGLGLTSAVLRKGAKARSFVSLRAVDLAGTVIVGVLFAANAVYESQGKGGALTTALAIGHLLIVRAVVVPSSGRWTLVTSLCTAVAGLVGEGTTLALLWTKPGPVAPELLPITGIWLGVSVLAATVSSRIIFGLRGEAARLRVAGQYVIHEKIGEGSMGQVYRATHAMLRRPAALKLLEAAGSRGARAAAAAEFEREVQHTARLRHPNTITVFDYGRTTDGVFYYAMEHVEGWTLQRLVEETGPLPASRVVHLLDQILASLAEAHGENLVHRDVKPANVMVVGRIAPDSVKVLDFGLAQDVSRPPEGGSDDGRIVGTPAYIAPERLTPGAEVAPASDLYSVAAVGYFLLTGTTVFRAATLREMLRQQRSATPEPPAERLGAAVPERLATLVLAGLAKDPVLRPASAEDFRQQLRAAGVPVWSEAEARAWWEDRLALLPTWSEAHGPGTVQRTLTALPSPRR
jgi:serine/threonine-protein kinase